MKRYNKLFEQTFAEPSPEDYAIEDLPMKGYNVGQIEGDHLGEFSTVEEALAAIRDKMTREKYWPNIWFVSDHGNASLIDQEGNIIE